MNIRAIAEAAADRLFTNGDNRIADRLALMLDGRDMGGWCKGAVVAVIREKMDKAVGARSRADAKLRDKFATAALANHRICESAIDNEKNAAWAYNAADAMLKERAQ